MKKRVVITVEDKLDTKTIQQLIDGADWLLERMGYVRYFTTRSADKFEMVYYHESV